MQCRAAELASADRAGPWSPWDSRFGAGVPGTHLRSGEAEEQACGAYSLVLQGEPVTA